MNNAWGGFTGLLFPALICLSLLGFPAGALPNGTETIITTDTPGSIQQNPVLDVTLIVWDDQRLGTGMNTIYAYNLLTGAEYPVLPDPSNPMLWQTMPSVKGDWIVWQQDDYTRYAIVAFNTVSRETIAVPATPRGVADSSNSYLYTPSDNVIPRTNGKAVVWQDFSNNPFWGIYLSNLTPGYGGSAEPIIADPAYDQKSPAISGEYIVYENWSGGQSDIYLYFHTNKTALRISQFSNDDLNPSIDGTRIVWHRNNETTGFNAIYLYDLMTGRTRQLTPAGSLFNQVNAKISGNLVVVQDDRLPGAMQVYAYRLTTNPPAEMWITPASGSMKINPAVSGNRVVWEDYRNGVGDDSDIYLLTLGSSETCPVADFTLSPSAITRGDTVTFSAAGPRSGASAILHRVWNFSDGSPWEPAPGPGVSHSYSKDGVFPVKLTVGNAKCRNISVETCSHKVFVNSPPVADFTAIPEYGLAPLAVRFTDISCGIPRNWSWDFGDGNTSLSQNPLNIFVLPGREYTVTLTVNNTNADSAPSTLSKTVRTFMGAQGTARTPVDGIVFDNRFGGQFLTYDNSVLPSHSPSPPSTTLSVYPPAGYGWNTITFIASDNIGVRPASPNQTYFANVSRIYLKTDDIIATTSGTPPAIGSNWGTSYQINTTTYPQTSSLKTEIWEGAVPADRKDFDYLASHAVTPHLLRDIAYTVKITKQQFVNEGEARINMSVGSSWAASADNVYILGLGFDTTGNRTGAIIPVNHVVSSGGLEYYEAQIPTSAHYLSTFGLVDLSGSYNPFQLITLTVTSHVPSPAQNDNPSSDSDSDSTSGGGAGAGRVTVPVKTPTPTNTPTPMATVDPGKSAKIYTNANGVVSQATRLPSNDGRALVMVGEGVVAKDASGNPLPEITIQALPSGSLPPVPSGSVFTFAGMAYEVGPEGATFSPPISLSFTVPQAQWGQDYVVKSFDRKSGTWQDLRTTLTATTGTVTAQSSHLCIFGLFTEPRAAPPAPAATPVPLTAVSIFASMTTWVAGLVMNNVVPLVAFIFLGIAGYLVMLGRFPGSGQ
jgi:beta propeller repeat protein